MRPIKKKCPPTLAKQYKSLLAKEPNPNFDKLKDGAGTLLKNALAHEQGYLCCYCMGAIKARKDKDGNVIMKDGLPDLAMKIEHFKSQNYAKVHDTGLLIDYKNLLCACEGGSDNKKEKGAAKTYCDSHKLGTDFEYISNPSAIKSKDFQRILKLKYNRNGKVSSDDENIDDELGTILNLNNQTLRKARAAAWDSISDKMSRHCKTDNWDDGEAYAKDLLHKFSNRKKSDQQFFAYCEMLIFLLKKRFKKI